MVDQHDNRQYSYHNKLWKHYIAAAQIRWQKFHLAGKIRVISTDHQTGKFVQDGEDVWEATHDLEVMTSLSCYCVPCVVESGGAAWASLQSSL